MWPCCQTAFERGRGVSGRARRGTRGVSWGSVFQACAAAGGRGRVTGSAARGPEPAAAGDGSEQSRAGSSSVHSLPGAHHFSEGPALWVAVRRPLLKRLPGPGTFPTCPSRQLAREGQDGRCGSAGRRWLASPEAALRCPPMAGPWPCQPPLVAPARGWELLLPVRGRPCFRFLFTGN